MTKEYFTGLGKAQNAVAVMLLFYEVVTVIDEHLIGSIYRVVIDVERFATALTSDLLEVYWFNILKVRHSIENVSEATYWAYGHKVFIARVSFGGVWNIRHVLSGIITQPASAFQACWSNPPFIPSNADYTDYML